MELRKPIKRSTEIAPLSREHHEGLLLCWKIRTGLRNEIDAGRIGAYVLHAWETHLKDHFLHEEKYLFPLLPADHPKRMQAIREHTEIIAQIRNIQDRPGYIALGKLVADLEAHIRFEERDLFNTIEQSADPAELKKAGDLIAGVTHISEEVWSDNFWQKGGDHVL